MKKLAFLGGAAGLGLMALLGSPLTQAADHLDSTALATNPMADINDVYAWMTGNGAKIALAMTVSPFDDGTRNFGPSVQYVFHVSHFDPFPGGFPQMPQAAITAPKSRIICTFANNTDGKCWVVDPQNKVLDYVEGDFSAATGKASYGGKFRVFAGRRSDPFFFNLAGLLTAKKKLMHACSADPTMEAACPGVLAAVSDAAGCPSGLTVVQTGPVAEDLSEPQAGPSQADPTSTLGPCPANQLDCFADRNVMGIVVELDKDLLASEAKPLLSVYASTHMGE